MKPAHDVKAFELGLGADLRQLLLAVRELGDKCGVVMVTGEISTRSRCFTVRRST